MKTLLLLLLIFTISCKHSSDESSPSSEGMSSGSTSSVEPTPSPVPTPVPVPTPTPTPTPPTDSTTVSPTYSTDAWTEEFMDLINTHRTSIGLRALTLNEDVSAIVRAHSQDMASGTVAFGHIGFSSRCSQAYSILGGGNWCGENVAEGQKTPEAAYTAWMNSPGHKANIESSRATYTGFGYAKSASGTYYWTQIFIEH